MRKTKKCTPMKSASLINQCAKRANAMAAYHGLSYPIIDAMMDLECGIKQFGIDPETLLKTDDLTFAHDVFGIYHNINRKIPLVENGFQPRTALTPKLWHKEIIRAKEGK